MNGNLGGTRSITRQPLVLNRCVGCWEGYFGIRLEFLWVTERLLLGVAIRGCFEVGLLLGGSGELVSLGNEMGFRP